MATSSTPNGGDAAGEPAAGAHPKLGSASETVVVAMLANRHAAERMLAALGRDLVRCADPGEAAAVVALAAERAGDSWHGSRAEFVAGLGQGAGNFDWLLAALDEPPPSTPGG